MAGGYNSAQHGNAEFSDALRSNGEGHGVALSVKSFAYGLRRAIGKGAGSLQKLARFAKPVCGLVLVGALVLTSADKLLEAALLEVMPDWLLIFTTGF